MKKISIITIVLLLILGTFHQINAQTFGGGSGTINQLEQWRSTTTPASAIVPTVTNKAVRIPNLGSTGSPCVSVSTNGTLATTTCGSGGGTPAGASSTVQFNANGAFGGSSNFTFNGTTATFANSPIISSGTDTRVPFYNSSKAFTDDSKFVYNSTTKALTLDNLLIKNTGSSGSYPDYYFTDKLGGIQLVRADNFPAGGMSFGTSNGIAATEGAITPLGQLVAATTYMGYYFNQQIYFLDQTNNLFHMVSDVNKFDFYPPTLGDTGKVQITASGRVGINVAPSTAALEVTPVSSSGGTTIEYPVATTFTTTYFPITPSTVSINYYDTCFGFSDTISDDGAGNFYSNCDSHQVGHLDYSTGDFDSSIYGGETIDQIDYTYVILETTVAIFNGNTTTNGNVTITGDTLLNSGASINWDSGNVTLTQSAGLLSLAGGDLSVSARNIITDTTTGTKIGTATNQKLGFFNATPVVQQANTTDLGVVLSNLGLRASGTAYSITTTGQSSLANASTTNLTVLNEITIPFITSTTTATSTFAGTVKVTSGSIINSEFTVSTSSTMTIDWNKSNQQLVKLGSSAVTINMTNYIAGQTLRLPVCQNSIGGATVTWDSKILWASSTAPTLSTANHCDLMTFTATNGTSTLFIMGGYINF